MPPAVPPTAVATTSPSAVPPSTPPPPPPPPPAPASPSSSIRATRMPSMGRSRLGAPPGAPIIAMPPTSVCPYCEASGTPSAHSRRCESPARAQPPYSTSFSRPPPAPATNGASSDDDDGGGGASSDDASPSSPSSSPPPLAPLVASASSSWSVPASVHRAASVSRRCGTVSIAYGRSVRAAAASTSRVSAAVSHSA